MPAGVPGMDLLPSNIDLSAAEVQLVHEVAREQTLQRVLAPAHRELRRHPDRLPALARPAHRQRADRLRRRDRAAGVRVLRAARRRPAQDHDRQGPRAAEPQAARSTACSARCSTAAPCTAARSWSGSSQAWGDKVFHTVIRRTVKFSDSTVAGEPITTYAIDLDRRRGLPPAGQGGAGPVSRRVSLPAADDLFRPTARQGAARSDEAVRAVPDRRRRRATTAEAPSRRRASRAGGCGTTRR